MTTPFIVEGEVLEVLTPEDGSNIITYLCEVNMPNHTKITVSNCIQASFFGGGIENYTRQRLRARNDDNDFESDGEAESFNASKGDKVYIAFVNGALLYPLIIGYAQHLNQSDEDVVNPETKPASVKQFLGFRQVIDEEGNVHFVRKGAPKEVKYIKKNSLSLSQPTVLNSNAPKILGKSNPAIDEQTEDEIVILDLYKGGIFRARDSKGGLFELDHNKNRVYISNNDLKSTEDPESGPASGGNQAATNSTDAEYILLDREKELVLVNARKILQLYSFDQRKDVTEGDFSHKIQGNDTTTVTGDCNYSANSITYNAKQNIEISSSGGDISIKSPVGKLNITKDGKISIGTDAVEIVTLFAETLKALVDNASTFVSTSTGPGVLSPAIVTAVTKSQTLLESIKS